VLGTDCPALGAALYSASCKRQNSANSSRFAFCKYDIGLINKIFVSIGSEMVPPARSFLCDPKILAENKRSQNGTSVTRNKVTNDKQNTRAQNKQEQGGSSVGKVRRLI
jgi:hypothetical protein